MCEMYTQPVSYSGDEMSDGQSQETTEEDKVILETEITLRTGPNITMKIHEESRPNSVLSGVLESEEDTRRQGVVKVLNDDSESDYYNEARKSPRTPKKVRFGGESIKLRTPESDSSQQPDDDEDDVSSIKITVTDAISIKTRKSLIPVRISSLPSTPKKNIPYDKSRKHYRSAPNLTSSSSKIPLRRSTMREVKKSMYLKPNNVDPNTTCNKTPDQSPKREAVGAKDNGPTTLKPTILKRSRANDVLSPIPIHNEIEVFHNLSRSPDRSRRNSTSEQPENVKSKESQSQLVNGDITEQTSMKEGDNEKVNQHDVQKQLPEAKSYNSFTVWESNGVKANPNSKKLSLQHSLSSLTSDDEIWAKSEALESLVKMLKQPGTCQSLDAGPAALLFEALFACHHRDRLHNLADDALIILIQGLRLEVLEQCLSRLTLSICKMGSSSGVRCALAVMKKLSPKKLQSEILSRAFGHRTREGALQILMACARLYPRQDVSAAKIAEFAAQALRDRRRRVRHAALETLAAIAQLTSTFEVLNIVENTIKDYLDFKDIFQVVRTRHEDLDIVSITDLEQKWGKEKKGVEEAYKAKPFKEFCHPVIKKRKQVFHDSQDLNKKNFALLSSGVGDSALSVFLGRSLTASTSKPRLSRKQLPAVDLDGSIRYSSPTQQTESDWICGASLKNTNVSASPLSSASSSSTPSVNYWMHNSRHDSRFTNGSALTRRLSESYEEDAFDDSGKVWAIDTGNYSNLAKASKGPRANVLHPVYILQPEVPSAENGKNGRGHRRYDRGRSFSPPKQHRGQFQTGLVEAIPVIPVYGSHNGNFHEPDKNFGSSDISSRLQYPESGVFRPHGFRKSFSSDQLYFSDRLPPKQEPYSLSLSSRSSSTSTGSSTRSGFWHKDFRSGIPIPISETKLKIRHSTSSIVSSGGPLIAKRSTVPSPQRTPTSSKSSAKDRTATVQDDGSISRLPLPPPRSSGSDSSGYFTPSPPEVHQPGFIKMETEVRLSSAIEEPLGSTVNNNSGDSHSAKSVGDRSPRSQDNDEANITAVDSANVSDCLGETIHDNYPSEESVNLNNSEENPERRPPSRAVPPLEPPPATLTIRRKSKSVVDLPNFLPKISPTRKVINSAPPRNDQNTENNNLENMAPPIVNSPPSAGYPEDRQEEMVTTTAITATRSKLERRFSRNGSKKLVRASPRVSAEPPVSNRPASKPKDVLQHVLHQMENPNWETVVEGLQGLAKLVRQHPDVVEHQMHNVCVVLGKHIKNLRSQVSRTACNTTSELFLSCKRGLDMELEEIACPLLQRTADTNRFLRADANAALDIMCEQLPAHRVIPVVTSRGCGHQNAVVRATAIRMLGDITRRLGAERIFQLPKEMRDKLLLAGANSLADGNLDARCQGKALFRDLMGHPYFQRYLHDAVPQNILRHISKGLSSIKSEI